MVAAAADSAVHTSILALYSSFVWGPGKVFPSSFLSSPRKGEIPLFVAYLSVCTVRKLDNGRGVQRWSLKKVAVLQAILLAMPHSLTALNVGFSAAVTFQPCLLTIPAFALYCTHGVFIAPPRVLHSRLSLSINAISCEAAAAAATADSTRRRQQMRGGGGAGHQGCLLLRQQLFFFLKGRVSPF